MVQQGYLATETNGVARITGIYTTGCDDRKRWIRRAVQPDRIGLLRWWVLDGLGFLVDTT
jgi:hypothetical protein